MPASATFFSSVSNCRRASGVLHAGDAQRLPFGWRVMIGGGEREIRTAHFAAVRLQPGKRLRGRHLVDEVQINIEKVRPVRFAGDEMGVVDLVVEGFTGHGTGGLGARGAGAQDVTPPSPLPAPSPLGRS